MPLSERMFNDDPLAQRAAVLSLIIIGEEFHNYEGIDTDIIWETITQEILELKHQIEIILSQKNELLDDEGRDIKDNLT